VQNIADGHEKTGMLLGYFKIEISCDLLKKGNKLHQQAKLSQKEPDLQFGMFTAMYPPDTQS
jgi:hypothetical protein